MFWHFWRDIEEVPVKWMDRPSATERGCASEMDIEIYLYPFLWSVHPFQRHLLYIAVLPIHFLLLLQKAFAIFSSSNVVALYYIVFSNLCSHFFLYYCFTWGGQLGQQWGVFCIKTVFRSRPREGPKPENS